MFVSQGIEVITKKIEGKKCPHLIVFRGDDLHLGKGEFEVHSKIGVEEDGKWKYINDPKSFFQINSLETAMNMEFDDGEGGKIKGSKVFTAMCRFVDAVWNEEILKDGNPPDEEYDEDYDENEENEENE